MASFHNVDGKDVKIETPLFANILPILTFSVTAGLVYAKTKSIGKSLGFGLLGAGVGIIPRLVLMKKGLDDVKTSAAQTKKSQTTQTTTANAPETPAATTEASNDDGETPKTPDEILSIIEKIAIKNGKQTTFVTKKNYFFKLLKNFSKKQRNAAYDTVALVEQMPSNPSEQQVNDTLESIAILEDRYGKEFLETINKKLKHISNEISVDVSKKSGDANKTTAA